MLIDILVALAYKLEIDDNRSILKLTIDRVSIGLRRAFRIIIIVWSVFINGTKFFT